MKAVVTGASSGIGRDIARVLSEKGYELILVARRKNRLIELKDTLQTDAFVYVADLSKTEECIKLCNALKDEEIDIFVNNAGVGLCGDFLNTELEKELEMIDLNIKSVHILTKFFAKKFHDDKKGFILNVSSSAAFLPGPFMAAYYATKSYVLRLSQSVDEELNHKKSNAYVSVLCPGPVNTEFDEVANVTFSMKGLNSRYVAEYAVKKAFLRKKIIIPGFMMKLANIGTKLLPDKILSKIALRIQKRKIT